MRRWLVSALLGLLLVACAAPPAMPANVDNAGLSPVVSVGDTIKIGGIFDLSGATSDVGLPYAEGVKAYVEWLNEAGGIAGRQVELLSADYAYKTENAERLYTKYVNQDRVVAIVGWGTGATEALQPRITHDQIPLMSASLAADLANAEQAPYNFVPGVSYSDQLRIVLEYLRQQQAPASDGKLAFMYHDSPFGAAPLPVFDEPASRGNLEVLRVPMPRGATDLTPQLEEVRQFAPDYVVIQNTPGPTALALRTARKLGMQTQFVLLNFAANEVLIEAADGAAEGVIAALPFAPPTPELPATIAINRFLQSHNRGSVADSDKGLLFVQGWTIMSVMAEGIRRAAEAGALDGPAIKAQLEQLRDVDTGGITAPLSFRPDNHQGARSLRLYQVVDGDWTPITEMLTAPTP